MRQACIFPADPVRAALTDPAWMLEQSERVEQLVQQAQLFGVSDLKLAVNPKDADEAQRAAKAYVTAVQYGKDPKRTDLIGLIILEAEPLYQNLLAWFRWKTHYKAPWNSLFERPAGITPVVLQNYANEGLIFSNRFGAAEDIQPHQRALKTAEEIATNAITDEEALKRVNNAARAYGPLLTRLNARRTQREIMLWGNDPREEYAWCAALGAYTQRVEVTSHLGTTL